MKKQVVVGVIMSVLVLVTVHTGLASQRFVEDFDSGRLDPAYWDVIGGLAKKADLINDGNGGYQLYLEAIGKQTDAWWMPVDTPIPATKEFTLEFDFLQPSNGLGPMSSHITFDNDGDEPNYGHTWTLFFGGNLEDARWSIFVAIDENGAENWHVPWSEGGFETDTKYSVFIHNKKDTVKITIRSEDKKTILAESDWILHSPWSSGYFYFTAWPESGIANGIFDNLVLELF